MPSPSPSPRATAPVPVLAARVTALVTALALLAAWTASTAQAAEPLPAPITDRALNQSVSTFPLAGPSSCVRTEPLRLGGVYVYGQRFGATVTHNHVGMVVPDGTYRLHDCVRDNPEFGTRERVSWLDPAPDPRDHTSGVIVTLDPLTGRDALPTHGPTTWGSWILADTPT